VEATLQQYPGLRECVVVAREDAPGDKRLVAYFIAASPAPAAGELRQFLSAKLPSYMVPSVFVPLEALPRTPNGKIDRRALPAPGKMAPDHAREVVGPRNPREHKLAAICKDVLKLTDFSIHDSLFDLGADSIQVFQIVARANDAGLNLSPKQILLGRTIAAICGELDKVGAMPRRGEGPPLAAAARDRYRLQRAHLSALDGLNGEGGV
jgi:hypothetical protein